MKVVWTPEAEQDRVAIFDYIAAEHPLAAVHMDQLFSRAAASLAEFPERGHPGVVGDTREVHPHYRLVYEVGEGTVWVLALVHTSRLWPGATG